MQFPQRHLKNVETLKRFDVDASTGFCLPAQVQPRLIDSTILRLERPARLEPQAHSSACRLPAQALPGASTEDRLTGTSSQKAASPEA